MITLSDQIFLSNILPLDYRASNLKISTNNIIVETIPYYLNRVDIGSRYPGMEVFILSPAGTYTINDFLTYISNGSISASKYKFINTSDSGFIVTSDSFIVIDDLTTGGSSDALSAQQGLVLKNLIDNHVADNNNPHEVTKEQIGLSNVPNLSFGGSNTGDETKQTIETKLGASSAINNGYLSSTDFNTFTNKQNPIQFGPRYTGSHSGYLGEMWLDDDYMYICVVAGIAGIAKWKKINLLLN